MSAARITEAKARVEEVRRVCDRLLEARDVLTTKSWTEIADVLGQVGARFGDPDDPLRAEALARLPDEAGLSHEMAEVVLDGMAADWTPERFHRLVGEEFPRPACLNEAVRIGGRTLMAFGPALCVQVVSGSVPGVGINALVRSLLAKAPTLIKPGRGDVALTELFARALEEADTEIASALAVRYWAGEDLEVTREAVRRADVVTVYGSDQTVASVRGMAAPTTRVVGYHHREAVAIVGREVLTRYAVTHVATRVARAVALFEQRGCVCPHAVYVERGGQVDPPAFADHLADAFRLLERSLPGPELHPDEGAAVQQLRGTAELFAATGDASVRHGGSRAGWTVVFEGTSGERLADGLVTLARGVRVRSVRDVADLPDMLAPDGSHLQSVGYAGLGERVGPLAEALGRNGASRVVPVERMSFPEPWWLHDGRGPLRELVRWLEVER